MPRKAIPKTKAEKKKVVREARTMYVVSTKDLLSRITIDPNVLHGQARVRGLPIPVYLIVGAAAKKSFDEILDEYPDLEIEDIHAALRYASLVVEDKDNPASAETFITRDPKIRNGRPCIAGTGVSVRRVAVWHKMGRSPEEIAEGYGHISTRQVCTALAYYYANRDEIEADLAKEEAWAIELERQHPLAHPKNA